MTSCLTLMPVSSVKAFASVLDSYSCVVIVSDTTLISMPLKGAAAFSYHCNSFSWSAFDSVEGWNSLSIHFCAVASSASAGAAIVTDAAISANALVIVRKLFLVKGPFLPLKRRILNPPVAATNKTQARVAPGSALFRLSDGAENRHGRNKRNHGCEPQARNFNALSDRQRQDRVGTEKRDPQQVDDRGQHQRDEQPVAARGRNPQHPDAFGLGIGNCQPRHHAQGQRQQHEEDRGRERPGHPCDVFHDDLLTPVRAQSRARCSCGRTRSPA